MAEKIIEFTTECSVKECGHGFRSAVENSQGIVGKINAVFLGKRLEFFTPKYGQNDEPFASLNDDEATFLVGASVPRGGRNARPVVVQMYVWERESSSEVHLLVDHGLGGGSFATKLLQAVRSEIESP